jgi:hypothetical protein
MGLQYIGTVPFWVYICRLTFVCRLSHHITFSLGLNSASRMVVVRFEIGGNALQAEVF